MKLEHLVITFEDDSFLHIFEYMVDAFKCVIENYEYKIDNTEQLKYLINSILNTGCILFMQHPTLEKEVMFEDIAYLTNCKIYVNNDAIIFLTHFKNNILKGDILVYFDFDNDFYIVK